MKRIIAASIVMLMCTSLFSQTILYRENFDAPSFDDSVSTLGPMDWAINNRLFSDGSSCDSNFVQINDSVFLITAPINCSGTSHVSLYFNHICKIENSDYAEVAVSINNGAWQKLGSGQYIHTTNSRYTVNGNRFNANTYPSLWLSSQDNAKPQNTWWMQEHFDISGFAGNQSNVRIRFTIVDGNWNGANLNHGWYIDNVRVIGANTEMVSPMISYVAPIPQDTISLTGPFSIYTWIKDSSGIDSVWIVYQIDGGADQSTPMINVHDSTYHGAIPSITFGHRIDYHVHAIDNSALHNAGNGVSHWFYTKLGSPDVIIGTGTATSGFPFYIDYGYSRSAAIYTLEDIGQFGCITNLAWSVALPKSYIFPVKIYVKTVPDTSFVPDIWSNLIADATMVYNGTTSFSATGWKGLILSTPFNYTSENLMVLCETNYGSGGNSYFPTFHNSLAPSKHLYVVKDNIPPANLGTVNSGRPNLRISFHPSYNSCDAGLIAITEPAGTIAANVPYSIMVSLKNYAIDTLDFVTIKWSLDGLLQDSIVWAGLLPQVVTTVPFSIDNAQFSYGAHTIKAWTEKPNGSTDLNMWNDTASVSFFACTSMLNGTYTIGSGGDFATLNDAVTALVNCGVSGPVVFNLANGIYTCRIVIPEIQGASAANNITFQSGSGNFNDVILSNSATGNGDNWVIKLIGADYMRFFNLTLRATTDNFSRVITAGDGSTNNIFEGNRIQGVYTTTNCSYDDALVCIGPNLSEPDSANTISNNIFENGSFGIIWYATSLTLREKGAVITNNTFINQHYRGMTVGYMDACRIESNVVTTNSTYMSFIGIDLMRNVNNMRILKNAVSIANGGIGIEISECNGTSINEGVCANNMINVAGSNLGYGILMNACSNQKVFYNSINMYASGASSAFYFSGVNNGLNNHIKNNIFAYTGYSSTGLAVSVSNTATITSMDYNDLYSTGTNLGYWDANQQSLSAWKATSSKDSNSVSVNPGFVSNGNLHTASLNVFGLGIPIMQIADDFDGDLRDPISPVIGADEFELPAYETQLINIVLPVNSCSHSASEDVSITVKNIGAGVLTNIDAYYVVNHGIPVHEIITGPIPSLASFTYTFSTKADLGTTGSYTIDVYINNPSDINFLNDTIDNYLVYTSNGFSFGLYTMGFENSEYCADWSMLSINGDSYTWSFPYSSSSLSHQGSMSARFSNGAANLDGDWLFSRCFPLLAGETYEISYWYLGGSTTIPSKLNLKYGLSATPNGMTYLLDSFPNILTNNYKQSTHFFVAPSTDTYYFGWFAYTTPGNMNMNIDDINVRHIPQDNLAALEFINPIDACTFGTEAISLKIRNIGFDTIYNPFSIGYRVSGSPTATTETVTYNLLPGDSIIHTFSIPAVFNVLAGDSTFQIKVFGVNTTDICFPDDTVIESVTLSFSPPGPATSNDTIAYGTSTSLSANSPYHSYWYSLPVGGSLLGEGSVFSTPILYGDATYYVEARDLHDTYVGPYNNTIGSTSYSNALYYMRFNVLDPLGIKINSVDVFPGVAAGAAYTIIVQNSASQQIASYSGVTTVAVGQRETVPVNFSIPFGSSYRMAFTVMPGMARNTTGVSYPYTWANEISIVGNNLSSNYYLYFYNWDVSTSYGCASHRLPANIEITGQPATEAGIVEIIEPAPEVSLGIHNIKVIIRNYGVNNLTSADIGWIVNGDVQAPFHWVGSLNTGAADTVIIGLYDFEYKPYPGLYNLATWTSNPNNLADNNILNDTAHGIIEAHDPFAGTYYIGTSASDFNNFTDAVLALTDWGVSGPVLILADTGTYVEQIIVPEIPGASAINTITFRSITAVNVDVVLQFAATGIANNYVLQLDGADFIAFEAITMKSVTSTTYGCVLDIRGGATYNRFENNRIESIVSNSSNAIPVYSTSSGADSYNRFVGNKILNGYYGVYFYGPTVSHEQGNHFENNEITGWNSYGIYVYYCDSIRIKNNNISNSLSSSLIYPIYLAFGDNGCIITGNNIYTNNSSATYGIYLNSNNVTATLPNLIANNFIGSQIGSVVSYGIYLSSSSYVNIYFNSVNIYGGSAPWSCALSQTGGTGNVNIVNNNLVNSASGLAYEILTPAAIGVSNYNNLYSTGVTLAFWGTTQAALAQLQSVSGKDANSLSVVPDFYSPDDPHTYSINLHHQGTAVADIAEDIDGDPRSLSNPCIGADEFQLRQIDAGISSIDAPYLPDSTGVLDLRVSLINCGLETLTAATINYEINGIQGPPYFWTGLLPSAHTIHDIIIDSAVFKYENYTIKAWTELPNDTIDLLFLNDSSTYSFFNCPSPFKGTYTIGSANCDFVNFEKAAEALDHCGIDSSVVFKANPGIYVSSLYLYPVSGASNMSTITFTSVSGNNNDVVIRNPNNDHNAIKLGNGAAHYTFDKLTIECTYTTNVIDLNGAQDIHISNSNIGSISTAYLSSSPIAGDCNHLYIENNNIYGGFIGVSLSSSSSVVIRNNNIYNWIDNGVFCSGCSNILISRNYFHKAPYSCRYPTIRLYSCNSDSVRIEKNVINGQYSSDGIWVTECYGSSNTPINISNNFISMKNLSYSEGILIDNSYYVDTYNNTVEIYGSNSLYNCAFHVTGSSMHLNIVNNVFSNSAGGYAYDIIGGTLYIESSDFNDLYSSGTQLGRYSASAFNSISGLQTLSGRDLHSINVNPSFFTSTNLHINNNPFLNGAGTPISGIVTDIDGDVRNLVSPDIGADEFDIIVGIAQKPYNLNGFVLFQNQPNPAFASTTIGYYLSCSGEVSFELINSMGQLVVSKKEAGQGGLNTIVIDVSDLHNGVYMYSVTYEGERKSRQMIIAK